MEALHPVDLYCHMPQRCNNLYNSRDYGVLIEEAGIALRGLFIVDPSGVLRFCFLVFYISNESQPSKGLFKCVHVTGKCQSTTCQLAEVWMKLFV